MGDFQPRKTKQEIIDSAVKGLNELPQPKQSDVSDLVERLKDGVQPVRGQNKWNVTQANKFMREAATTIQSLLAEISNLAHDNEQLMKAANIEANRAEDLQARVAELEGDLNRIKNMELPMCFDKPETDWLRWYTTATQMIEIAESAIAKAED